MFHVPYENVELITLFLCQELDVPITKTTIRKQLKEQPDYPGLLAISNILKNIGAENIAIKTTIDNLNKFPTPFIVQIKSQHENDFVNVMSTETDRKRISK